jgi:hypothetical protein
MQRPAALPLPPIRTLRGEVERKAGSPAAWVGPVRSGLFAARAEPEPLPADPRTGVIPGPEFIQADTLTGGVPGLELLQPEPLPPPAPGRLGGWQPLGAVGETGVEPEAELVLDEEASWLEEPEAIIEGTFGPEEAIGPLEGLTEIGDLPRDIEQAPRPATAWDLEAEPWVEAGPRPGWPGAEAVIEPEPAAAPEGPDATDLANHLERLADQLRMHGGSALLAAGTSRDRFEAAVAAALAGLIGRRDEG